MPIRPCLTLYIAFAATCSMASQADDNRAKNANLVLEKFLGSKTELNNNQYFLFSLRESIRPADLDRAVSQYHMSMNMVYLCTKRGVLGLGVPSDETIANRVNRVDLRKAMGSTMGNVLTPDQLGSDLASNDLKLCGFEVQMSAADVAKFSLEHQNEIIAIEIQNNRRKMMPINVKRDDNA